jgi:hypothetical protein
MKFERLRLMGESSYKNMRASGMKDVIFSGSGRRPSRNAVRRKPPPSSPFPASRTRSRRVW